MILDINEMRFIYNQFYAFKFILVMNFYFYSSIFYSVGIEKTY